MLIRPLLLALVLGVALLSASVARTAAPAANTPPNFDDQLVANVTQPTALAFAGTDLFVATKPGKLQRIAAGAPTTVLDIEAKVCDTANERGLLGVALDPAFAQNQHVYLYYTGVKAGSSNCAGPVNRVSRFTLVGDNAARSASEVRLIDNIPSPGGNHNGGDIHFGKDGYLYISVGDGGTDYAGDSGGAGQNDAARDRFILLGKILRVGVASDGTATIPPDNPFRGADSAACATTGRTEPNKICQETFAWGLRNPFRIAFDPNAATTRFFINDVGQNGWEEVDEGRAGADYGWNCREAAHPNSTPSSKCATPPGPLIDPIYEYAHTSGCRSITGGAFVPHGVWPTSFDGAYLFGDYVCGKIFTLARSGNGYVASEFVTGLGGSSAVHMTFGPYLSTQALYYTTFAGGGQVRRIVYTGTANRAPTARIAAEPAAVNGVISGPDPLAVTFRPTGSSDPDGDPLSYAWDFGNGAAGNGATPPSQVYPAGSYTVTLTVRDNAGATGSATVRVESGNSAPVPRIDAPASGKLFRVGEQIELRASATDADGDQVTFTWEVIQHHDTHTHPFLAPTPGATATIVAPPPEDLAAAGNSYLEIRLTASDGRSSTTIVQNLQPKKVLVDFATSPNGLRLSVNGEQFAAPRSITSWEGYVLSLAAPTQPTPGGWLRLDRWSQGGPAAQSVTTPAERAAFTATFVPADIIGLPMVGR